MPTPRTGPAAASASAREPAPAGGPGDARGRHGPPPLATVAACALAVLAGCGVGEGEGPGGEATLTVTRDYGANELSEATAQPTTSETVLRLLDRENEITTRYGGGFVQSIDGLSGGSEDGRRLDWFFYVNGTESSVGAAEVEVTRGDRIWWDYHDWSDVMRVPAVVGSWPAPFATSGRPELRCYADPQNCEEVSSRLDQVSADGEGTDGPTVLVGPWAELREEEEARPLERGPQASGVFARFERRSGGWDLVPLDEALAERERLAADAGLVAALSDGVGEPTWLVTGTDEDGVAAAAEALDESALGNRFAVATAPNAESIPLPVP